VSSDSADWGSVDEGPAGGSAPGGGTDSAAATGPDTWVSSSVAGSSSGASFGAGKAGASSRPAPGRSAVAGSASRAISFCLACAFAVGLGSYAPLRERSIATISSSRASSSSPQERGDRPSSTAAANRSASSP
jgi:hypothetical protein